MALLRSWHAFRRAISIYPALVFAQDGFDVRQQIQAFHLLDRAAFARAAEQTETMPVFVPVNDLVDATLLDLVGQGGLAGANAAAGQNVATAEGHASFLA